MYNLKLVDTISEVFGALTLLFFSKRKVEYIFQTQSSQFSYICNFMIYLTHEYEQLICFVQEMEAKNNPPPKKKKKKNAQLTLFSKGLLCQLHFWPKFTEC